MPSINKVGRFQKGLRWHAAFEYGSFKGQPVCGITSIWSDKLIDIRSVNFVDKRDLCGRCYGQSAYKYSVKQP